MERWILSVALSLFFISVPVAASNDEPIKSFYTIREKVPALSSFKTPLDAAILVTRKLGQATLDLLTFDYHPQSFPPARQPYDRAGHFGTWVNDPRDQNCYNTRAKVLIRDSKRPVTFNPGNHCVVAAGEWHEPYGGRVHSQASGIEIDHVVALKNAYVSGAHRWDFRARCLYANYLGSATHLLAVDSSENRSKSDRTPADWMPSDRRGHCAHLVNWLRVKLAWGLVLVDREARAIQSLARQAGCDARWFKIPAAELVQQRDIMRRNMNLCD